MEASSRLLGAPWGPSGPLGGLLGAPWGPFGGSGSRFDVKHHFETLEIAGRAALKPSWGRFFFCFSGHLGVIFEAFSATVVTAN